MKEACRSASDSPSEAEPSWSEAEPQREGRTNRSVRGSPSEKEPPKEDTREIDTRSRRWGKGSHDCRSHTYTEVARTHSPSSSRFSSRYCSADHDRDRAVCKRAQRGPLGARENNGVPGPQHPKRSWADRMSDPEGEVMDYEEKVIFSSKEEDQPISKVVEVLERTRAFLQGKCTQRVQNAYLLQIRKSYPLPTIRTPQLDKIMKSEVSVATKSFDKQLAKLQTLLLDSLTLLTALLETHHKGELLDSSETLRAVKAIVQLIGNANSNMSHLQRVRIIGDMNKILLPIVGDDSNLVQHLPSTLWVRLCPERERFDGLNASNEGDSIPEVRTEACILSKSPPPPKYLGGFNR